MLLPDSVNVLVEAFFVWSRAQIYFFYYHQARLALGSKRIK
jgi:hypothetical protein